MALRYEAERPPGSSSGCRSRCRSGWSWPTSGSRCPRCWPPRSMNGIAVRHRAATSGAGIRRSAGGPGRWRSTRWCHPVTRGEPHPIPAEPAFQHGDLMTQCEDLRVLVLVAHRQQPQQGEHVRRTQTGQSQQHDRPSCRGTHQVPRAPAQAPALDTTRTPPPPGRMSISPDTGLRPSVLPSASPRVRPLSRSSQGRGGRPISTCWAAQPTGGG